MSIFHDFRSQDFTLYNRSIPTYCLLFHNSTSRYSTLQLPTPFCLSERFCVLHLGRYHCTTNQRLATCLLPSFRNSNPRQATVISCSHPIRPALPLLAALQTNESLLSSSLQPRMIRRLTAPSAPTPASPLFLRLPAATQGPSLAPGKAVSVEM